MAHIDRLWRLLGTGLSFAAFGIGGLFISFTIFPVVHLVSRDRNTAHRRCQKVIQLCFRLFIGLMTRLGVLTYAFDGAERLQHTSGALVVANHPSLIDVVFIISQMPQALCVVKKSLWYNPFTMGVMRAAGYIPNDDPEQLIDDCVAALERGENLVIFPEGTRTRPGQPLKLKGGAASIIAAHRRPITPVHISCSPTTLTKHEKWYEIPSAKPHFHLIVGDGVDLSDSVVDGASRAVHKRRINRKLAFILEGRRLEVSVGY